MDYIQEYKRWCELAKGDADVEKELSDIAADEAKIEDAFYRNLAFGTGGLRGVIGAGTNRMNIHVVAKASQGLADYIVKSFPEKDRKIAVSYDSRIKSDLFSKVAAGVFAANGIKVYIYSELMPTPCLSYAVRALHCAAGIMVTASHNPSEYNGYKVYGADGCQITTEAAKTILAEIEKLEIFADVKTGSFEQGLESGAIEYISDDIYTAFVGEVKKQSVLSENDQIDKNVAIVYSPLHGTGLKPVLRTLNESGYTNITVVREQEEPDGNFTTCPYPNPEIKEAMSLGMEYAERYNADLLLATDPDCDRLYLPKAYGKRHDAAESRVYQNDRDDRFGRAHSGGLRSAYRKCADRLQVHRRADRTSGAAGKGKQLYFRNGRELWLSERRICSGQGRCRRRVPDL